MLKRFHTLFALSFALVSSNSWAAAPTILPFDDQYVMPGETISVRISAVDPDGGVPGLYIENMPVGASFDDNGDGTRTFNWTPDTEDFYVLSVIATDAQAEGETAVSALFVSVFNDAYYEPDFLIVDDYELSNIHPNGEFYLYPVYNDTLNNSTHYSLSVSEYVYPDYGYTENFVFSVGNGQLRTYSDYGTAVYYDFYTEIPNNETNSWNSQSRIASDSQRTVAVANAYEPAIVYKNDAGFLVEQSTLEPPVSINAAQRYTGAVAIDGQTIVTAHPADDVLDGNRLAGSGAVRVYDYDSTQWSHSAVIKAPNANEHDQFGTAIALDGEILVVSAIGEASAGQGSHADMFNNDFQAADPYSALAKTSGAVYVYERVLGTWINTAYLKASDNTASLRFGSAVAIDGEKIYVGAPARNIDTSLDYVDHNGNAVDENEGAVYVFEKNDVGDWIETHIIESVGTETKFGLYLSAKDDALAVGSAVATSLFAYDENQWKNLWFGEVAPRSIALGTEALAIGTSDGLQMLVVDDFYYVDEYYGGPEYPTFYGSDFNYDYFAKTVQPGEEISIVIGASQEDAVPGIYLAYQELGATLEDNFDGTLTLRLQPSPNDTGFFFFEVVATNALDNSIQSTTIIEIYIDGFDFYNPVELSPYDPPVFYGDNFDYDYYFVDVQRGEAIEIVISATQVDGVPGIFLNDFGQLGATLEDNLDGTRTLRWQPKPEHSDDYYYFEVIATNALDSSIQSLAYVDIYIFD